ncbi:MAG: cyclic nucleotide-binding domain-containing protein [Myxococcota bacterium]
MLTSSPESDLRSRFLQLRSMPFAAPLDDNALLLLSEHARYRRFKKGEALARSGRPIESMFVLVSGQVTATAHGHHLTTAGKNSAVGVTALLSRDPDGVTAIADEETEAIELPGEALFAAYREDFSLVRNVLRLQCRAILGRRNSLPTSTDDENPSPGTWRDGELTVVERVLRIRGSDTFANANLDAVFALARRSEEVRLEPGEALWRRGDPSLFWYQIEYGLVRCENAEGQQSVIGGKYALGIMDCWAESNRSYDAYAETAVIAQRTSLEAMLDVLETHHDLAMGIVAVVSRTNMNAAFLAS